MHTEIGGISISLIRDANELALRQGMRILSAYVLSTGDRIWIITEADRSVTTLLTPEEY